MRTAAAIVLACGLGLGTSWSEKNAARAEEMAALWRADALGAWKASQETGRPLLLFITSDNCPYCHLMDRNTFADQGVVARMRASFVAARVDASQQPELARHLQVRAYPTTVVVDRNNRVLGAIPGYLEPREFERRLAQFTQ